MTVRIHQLAKDIAWENKELLALLRSRGFEVKSASSIIDNITADALREEFPKDLSQSGEPDSAPPYLKLLNDCVIIDTSVWMDEKSKHLLEELRECAVKYKSFKILMLEVIYAELENHKIGPIQRKKPLARKAGRQILDFMAAGILDGEWEPNVDGKPNPNAYADPIIIETINEKLKAGISCTLIVEDVKLATKAMKIKSCTVLDMTLDGLLPIGKHQGVSKRKKAVTDEVLIPKRSFRA